MLAANTAVAEHGFSTQVLSKMPQIKGVAADHMHAKQRGGFGQQRGVRPGRVRKV